MTRTEFHHATPLYDYLEGWSEDIAGARSFEDLPKAAQQYVLAVEEISGARISAVGVGPSRGWFVWRDVEHWDGRLGEDETRYEHTSPPRRGNELEAFLRAETPLGLAGFRCGYASNALTVVAPGWFVVLVLLLPPASWLYLYHGRWSRLWRWRMNECIYCGYCRDASSGRCPECGRFQGHPFFAR